jgi:hypothetical protein
MIWGITCFLVLSISIAFRMLPNEFSEIITAHMPSFGFSGWVHSILGLLLIGIGVKKLKLVMEKQNHPAVQQAIEFTAFSITKATLKTELFSLINTLLLFLMIYKLLQRNMGLEKLLIASGMIAMTAMIWISLPLFGIGR